MSEKQFKYYFEDFRVGMRMEGIGMFRRRNAA